MTAIVWDTETTGTDPEKDQIIEAAHIIMPATPGELCAKGASIDALANSLQRYRPSVPISLGAQAVHHILESELLTCPDSDTFRLPEGVTYLIGHNIDFDWKMAGSPDIRRICTLAMSRAMFPDLDSHTQSAMIYYIARQYGREDWARETLKNAHAALDDVRNCTVLLRFLLRELARLRPFVMDDWALVWQYSEDARLPTVMGFGKHKGTKISVRDLDPGYVRWYRGQVETDPYYLEAFKRAGF